MTETHKLIFTVTLSILGIVAFLGWNWGHGQYMKVQAMEGEVTEARQALAWVRSEDELVRSGFLLLAKQMRVVVTGYAPDPRITDSTPWVTALGFRTGRRICAADPKVIPWRSFVYVPDLGLCLVGDSGSKVKGPHVDWAFDNIEIAREWGRKSRTVFIVTPKMLKTKG